MQTDGFAGDRATAGDDIEDALRQASFGAKLCKPEQRQRRAFGRLENNGIAHRKRRRDLPGADHHGEIPGHDGGDHPDRLAMDEREDIVGGRRDFAVHLVDRLGIVAEGPGRAGRFRLQGHRDFGAIVANAKNRKFKRMFVDKVRDLQHDLLAGGR